MGFYDGATGFGTGTSVTTVTNTIESILASLGGTRFLTPSQNLANRQRAIDALLNLALSGNAGAVQQLIQWSGFHGETGSIATDAAKQYTKQALVTYYSRSAVAVPSDLAAFLGIPSGVQPPAPNVLGTNIIGRASSLFGALTQTQLALGAAAIIGFFLLKQRTPSRRRR